MLRLLKQILKDKETKLTAALILGIILLSLGIATIKFSPLGTVLIIAGSSLIYISVIALVFVV